MNDKSQRNGNTLKQFFSDINIAPVGKIYSQIYFYSKYLRVYGLCVYYSNAFLILCICKLQPVFYGVLC